MAEYVFQSTRPIRGATEDDAAGLLSLAHFNPRAPYGARHVSCGYFSTGERFQSTRPIRGATVSSFLVSRSEIPFQSTRPIRGATHFGRHPRTGQRYFNPRAPYGARHGTAVVTCIDVKISIHAPHTGRDTSWRRTTALRENFNPRAPYGARLERHHIFGGANRFQSTRPIRGATAKMHNLCSAFLQQQTIKA